MSEPAFFGLGIEVRISDGAATPVFQAIPGLRSITGPGKTRDTVDVTSHSSVGGYREYIGGLRDGGDITCDMNWLFGDVAQEALETAFAAEGTTNFQMYFPQVVADNLLTFSGFVSDMSWNGPVDDVITRSLTIKVTGPITTGDEP